LEKLRRMAKKETRCPNNASIALAATLEDQLDEGMPLEEIGELYFKGGDCLTQSPSDRESLLTRAGLFYFAKGNYKRAGQIFKRASNVPEAFVSRPLYWLYRTQLLQNKEKDAKITLGKLQAKYPFSFHTLVALTTQGKDPGTILDRDISPVFTRSQNTPSLNHLLEAQEWLNRFGFASSSAKVLEWALRASQGVEPEVMVYLAELKEGHGDHHGKISILTDVLYNNPALVSRETLEQYFPKVFFPVFEKQSRVIDPYLLIAVARRESAFRINAVSGAKARGLLQIMPATGRRVASGEVNLLDPDTNVEIGAKYLTQLLEKTNGQIHLALAGYNAGPHKVSAWTRRYPVSDPILFIDMIPYRETREYVASVLRNYYWYRRIHQNDNKWNSNRWIRLATSPDDRATRHE
jgi:soluble lytic murein transglycosylase